MAIDRLLFRLPLALYGAGLALRALLPGGRAARARLARDGSPHPAPGPRLWLHAASNGELTSARAVLAEILARDPDLSLVITTNSETARALGAGWALPRSVVTLAPLDTAAPLRRFLARWQPLALVTVETELWPARFAACRAEGIPVLIVGARLSARSHRRWRRLAAVAREMLGAVAYLSAQDEASADRFADLGLDPGRIGPTVTLKSAAGASRAPSVLAWPRALTVLAASTHPGEEEIVLSAFMAAHRENQELRLILAPRHARRGKEVAASIRAAGLTFATRSAGEMPTPETPVFLADTMGEMDLWYGAAGLCFTGGSLVDHGGHTPFEPAAHGAAILHGPYTANSAPAYEALAAAGASEEVGTAEALAAAILRLADPAEQARRAAAATTALAPFADLAGLDRFYGELARTTDRPALARPIP